MSFFLLESVQIIMPLVAQWALCEVYMQWWCCHLAAPRLAGCPFWRLLLDMSSKEGHARSYATVGTALWVISVRTLLQHDKGDRMRTHFHAPSGIWSSDPSFWMVKDSAWHLSTYPVFWFIFERLEEVGFDFRVTGL
jgi:hypothetical protein